MHPYRDPPDQPEPAELTMPPEERFLIGLLIAIGGVRLVVAFATGEPLDAEPTLGLAMFIAGVWWGMRSFRMRRRRPRGD